MRIQAHGNDYIKTKIKLFCRFRDNLEKEKQLLIQISSLITQFKNA